MNTEKDKRPIDTSMIGRLFVYNLYRIVYYIFIR